MSLVSKSTESPSVDVRTVLIPRVGYKLPVATTVATSVGRAGLAKLTAEQQALVANNLPLVALHLKKRVGATGQPRRDREYDDLYQEGAMALIRASQSYDPRRHGPFAGYAIPRIRAAVHQALYETFQTVHIPVGKTASDRNGDLPRCHSLGPFEPIDHTGRLFVSEARKESEEDFTERFDRILETARTEWLARRKGNPAGVEAIGRIIEERMRVPDEAWRTSLESIARSAGVAKSTVLRWERQLYAAVRRRLAGETDAQAGEPAGATGTEANPSVGKKGIVANRDPEDAAYRTDAPARLLWTLLEAAGRDPYRLADEMLAGLSPGQRRKFDHRLVTRCA